jgi:alpha-tubulin suppressor-like RCC1 family protein
VTASYADAARQRTLLATIASLNGAHGMCSAHCNIDHSRRRDAFCVGNNKNYHLQKGKGGFAPSSGEWYSLSVDNYLVF